MGCCSCYHNSLRVPLRWLFSVVEIAICIGIVTITYYHLTDVTWSYNDPTKADDINDIWNTFNVTEVKCALGTWDQGADLCTYAYIICGITFVVCIMLIILAHITGTMCCNQCCLFTAPWFEVSFAVTMAVIWVCAGLVVVKYGSEGNDQNLAREEWRNAVIALCWLNALLFSIQAIFILMHMFYAVCGCCGGREDAEARKQKMKEAKEAKAAEKAGDGSKPGGLMMKGKDKSDANLRDIESGPSSKPSSSALPYSSRVPSSAPLPSSTPPPVAAPPSRLEYAAHPGVLGASTRLSYTPSMPREQPKEKEKKTSPFKAFKSSKKDKEKDKASPSSSGEAKKGGGLMGWAKREKKQGQFLSSDDVHVNMKR